MNSATLCQFVDMWRIKVRLSVKSASEIEFLNNAAALEILSTSHGFIRGSLLIIPMGVRYMEVILEHVPKIKDIECIINQPNGEQKVISLSIPSVDALSRTVPEIKTVNSADSPEGVKIFYKPDWQVKLSVVGDLRVSVIDNGGDIFAALGDVSKISGASDFVFPISKYHDHIVVPKEIVWMKHKEYKGHKLGCYELVKLHHRPNILYKYPISNNLDFSDLPQQVSVQLGKFRWPTGIPFNSSHWHIDEKSNLPVYSK